MKSEKKEEKRKQVLALVIPSLCYGGAERQVVEIARNIDKSRFIVHIITLSDYMPILPLHDPLRSCLHVVQKRGKVDVTLPFRLARLFKRLRVDVAHGFLFYADAMTRIAGRLSNATLVVGSERNSGYMMPFFKRLLLQFTSRFLDIVIANSSSGAVHHAMLYGLPREKYHILHNGVNVTRFQPVDSTALRKELGYETDDIVIGMFASFKKQKNHMFLFKVLESVVRSNNRVRLLLVGDTLYTDYDGTVEYKRDVIRTLDETGLKQVTQILGNRTDVEALYPVCDFTVLPSLHEGTPNVVLESMACGVPVVVSDVSDNDKLICSGVEGFVLPLNDDLAFIDSIESLCGDGELLRNMSKQSRKGAESRFATEVMGNNAAVIYEQGLEKALAQ